MQKNEVVDEGVSLTRREQGTASVLTGTAGRWPAFRAPKRGPRGMRAGGPRSQGWSSAGPGAYGIVGLRST